MPDSKSSKPVEAATAAPGEKRAAAPPRGRASESGDPDVQKALGDLNAAEMNLASLAEAVDLTEAKARVKAARARLAELGYQ